MVGRDFKLSSSESTLGVGVFAKAPLSVVGAAFDLGFSVVLDFVEWNFFWFSFEDKPYVGTIQNVCDLSAPSMLKRENQCEYP